MANRLDRELAERGLVRSRSRAQELIASGRVQVNGEVVRRPSQPVTAADELVAQTDHYVSRAAHKLLGALDDLDIQVTGRVLDAGASTGGFTQVLLERGASRVVAVDVGTDQLDPLLGGDPRVLSLEQTNLRDLDLATIGGPMDLVVADLSFISLTQVMATLTAAARTDGALLLMVKPQFEVGRSLLGKGGVVRELALHRQAIDAVAASAAELGWWVVGGAPSRLPGPSGNQEFFLLLSRTAPLQATDVNQLAEPYAVASGSAGERERRGRPV